MKNSSFTIEPFFIHQPLTYSILPKHLQMQLKPEVLTYEKSSSPSKDMFIYQAYAEYVEEFLKQAFLPSLEEQLSTGRLQEGQLVWTKRTFQFKGSIKALQTWEKTSKASYGCFYSIDSTTDDRKIIGRYNVEHFTTNSTVGILSGKSNLFILGYVEAIMDSGIELRPAIIGRCIYNIDSVPWPSHNILECNIDDIDQFSQIRKISRQSVYPYLELNKSIPEKKMKEWIAKLIGTTDVPKDWGGEKLTKTLF